MISYLSDMDGVLIKEGEMIPGADKFIQALKDNDIEYMVLTNNSMSTPRDLAARLRNTGLDIPAERIWTSATATANFLATQASSSKAYVVGESGLTTALHEAGWILTNDDADFVVLGETRTYSFEAITTAINLIRNGARFIATNREPYYVGKPNPVMMRSALNHIGAHSENTIMIGDRMDTDVKAGLEAGMRSILVRSGISDDREISRYPYRPTAVFKSVAEIPDKIMDPFADEES